MWRWWKLVHGRRVRPPYGHWVMVFWLRAGTVVLWHCGSVVAWYCGPPRAALVTNLASVQNSHQPTYSQLQCIWRQIWSGFQQLADNTVYIHVTLKETKMPIVGCFISMLSKNYHKVGFTWNRRLWRSALHLLTGTFELKTDIAYNIKGWCKRQHYLLKTTKGLHWTKL